MKLKFTKMHGLGNDFMVIDGINQSINLTSELVKLWSDRHFGIGFDQLLLVHPPSSPDVMFDYRIYNADGDEVEQCGNGARCFARFVREKGLTTETVITVQTLKDRLTLEVIDDAKVRVNMGTPDFTAENIPCTATPFQDHFSIGLDGKRIEFDAVSMGNPHMVLQVDDIDNAKVELLGPVLESHPAFPDRANVGFMQINDRKNFSLRVYERGVGETLACGSGACAAMAVGVNRGWLGQSASAHLLGGTLDLSWKGDQHPVMMTGGTASVFEGEISI